MHVNLSLIRNGWRSLPHVLLTGMLLFTFNPATSARQLMTAEQRAVAVTQEAIASAQQAVIPERIELFDSILKVEASGDFLVTETIKVVANGVQIKRGIYRDFPVVQRQSSGLIRRYGFEVLSVTRDGKPEPWHEVRKDGVSRIYFGDENVLLEPGPYTYKLIYRTTGQLRKLEGFDEIYWNVTGNDWALPILMARSTIVLPDSVTIIRDAFYTGVRGEQGTKAYVNPGIPGAHQVITAGTLGRGEGLTVAIAIPENSIAGAQSQDVAPVADNLGLFAYAFSPLALLAYAVWAWRRVGRDPPPGVVFPRFDPPDGLSPAAVSYIYHWGRFTRMGGASRALIAALMSLAVKGRLKLAKTGKQIEVSRVNQTEGADNDQPTPLPVGEQALYSGLLTGESIVLDKTNKTTISRAVREFELALKSEYGDGYFRHNIAWLIPGALIAVAGFLMATGTWLPSEVQGFCTIVTVLVSVSAFILTVSGYRMLRGTLPGHRPVAAWARLLAGLVLLAALIAVLVLSPWLMPEMAASRGIDIVAAVMSAAALTLIGTIIVLYALIFAPTEKGRRVADEIAGFRQYLAVAEGQRMNLMDAPEFDTTLFERYLPYAIALGVEKPWADTLETHLANSLPEARSSYRPSYYTGSDFSSRNISKSTAGITSSIGSSFASAMPSSSGSGGSGSSGGGGGGGGGGGW